MAKRMSVGTPRGEPVSAQSITFGDADEQLKMSVTSTETSQAFSTEMKYFFLYNDGPNAVHLDNDETATTNSFKIPPKAYFYLGSPTTTIHAICASGQTATLYVWGVR